jgi:hypothetical protein
MNRLSSTLFLIFFCALPVTAAEVSRRIVVLAPGENQALRTASTIATVNYGGTNRADSAKIASFAGQQYGNSVAIRGIAPGEVKLLVESTASVVSEVIHVRVVDRQTAARHREIVASITRSGIHEDQVLAAPGAIVITGSVYSPGELELCRRLQTGEQPRKSKAPRVICAARLISVSSVVTPASTWQPFASATIQEHFDLVPGSLLRGEESLSRWSAEIRLVDVPVARIAETSHTALVQRLAGAISALDGAITSWSEGAAAASSFPMTVLTRTEQSSVDVRLQWNVGRASRSVTFLRLNFEELRETGARASVNAAALADWWGSILQDALRLYLHGDRPIETARLQTDTSLIGLYRNALRLDPTPLAGTNVSGRLARSYTALRWSLGRDPFAELLESPSTSSAGSTSTVSP